MRKYLSKILFIFLAVCMTGCISIPEDVTLPPQTTEQSDTQPPATNETTEPTTTEVPETSEPETTATEEITETDPPHSELYIEGLSVDDVILYFNEVSLDAEFSDGGDATLLQKWDIPIYYVIIGNATDEDLKVLTGFADWLNTIEGFPGIYEANEDQNPNLQIFFCTENELIDHLGKNFYGVDGGVTFWYMDNMIYREIICYRTDLNQQLRNSVILEEIYNGLGPVQDSDLREDSLIYSGYSEPQSLTAIDELILKLLYHPDMKCGMNAAACEEVIRRLYY